MLNNDTLLILKVKNKYVRNTMANIRLGKIDLKEKKQFLRIKNENHKVVIKIF